MEAHDQVAMKKPVWPQGKPIPAFKSYAEEVKFWHSYDFDSAQPEGGWEAVPSTTKGEAEPKRAKRTAKVAESPGPVRRRRAAGA